MAVVPFPNLSPQGPNPQFAWGQRTISARQKSPLGVGVATTLERPGSEWTARLPYANLVTSRRARLQSFAASCRGYANRFYMPTFGWTRRGSFPSTELLTNNYFASGTTGWEVSVANEATLSASDGLLRATRAANTSSYLVRQSAAATVVQYAPYAARALTVIGRGSYVGGTGQVFIGSTAQGSVPTDYGLHTAAFVPLTTSAQFGVVDIATGKMAGDSFLAGYTSLARCALVDNGPNLLLRSEEFDNASWTKTRSSVTANTATAPNGTNTGETLIEDATATNTHFVQQAVTVSSAVADYSFACALKAGTRTFASLQLIEGTGSTTTEITVNLSTGVITTFGPGANWANLRAFSQSLGNGWYYVAIVATKTNAATSITGRIHILSDGDGTFPYTGDGASFIAIWRATLAQSSVPTRLVQTTSAATSGTSQTGSGIHLKGLPASTDGLLLQGDPVEIVTGSSTQMVRTRATLNSDASGRGYFEFEAPIRVSPSDNAAVIIHNPLCRMMLDSPNVEWSEHSGGFSDLEFACVEDTYP